MLSQVVEQYFPHKPRGYFDTAAVGLVPTAVGRAVAECYDALSSGVRGACHLHTVLEQALEGFAAEFGVAEADLAFMASTGEAMNAIARAVPWRPGDEVVVLRDDFPTVISPWLGLGQEVRVLQVEHSPEGDRTRALVDAVGPSTRVIAVSHVSSSTGEMVDLAELAKACTLCGAMLVCDGAQGAGCIPPQAGLADFYIATGYKWLLGGFGVAVVASKHESSGSLRPTLRGHANPPPSTRLPYGHTNYPGVFALEAARKVRSELGGEALERLRVLAGRLYTGCVELGFEPATNLGHIAGIVSLRGIDRVGELVSDLASRGLSVAERSGYLRMSPNFYTSGAEVDELLFTLERLRDHYI